MRVFYLAHRLPYPVDKGEKIRTFHQIQYLAEHGYDVTVFAPVEHDDELRFAEALAHKLAVHVFTGSLASSIKRKLCALWRGKPISETHFFSKALFQQFLTQLALQQPAAIVCTSSAMAAYVFAIQQAQLIPISCRLLMDFMDLDSDKWAQYAAKATIPMRLVYQREAKLVAMLEQQVYAAFDRCFFISENEIQLFSARLANADKLAVLANGIDNKVFYPKQLEIIIDLAAPVFLFTGVMNYLPNEDAVLWFVESMWGAIKKQWPKATFYIAGMQPSPRIQELAKTDGIIVTGYVDDILPYYHKADIFVGPFRLARGVQNKILQAMACGLPVVTTAMGVEGIDCQPGQDILVADNETDFISAISRLLSQPELMKVLGQNALNVIEQKYSWHGVLQQLPAFITNGVAE